MQFLNIHHNRIHLSLFYGKARIYYVASAQSQYHMLLKITSLTILIILLEFGITTAQPIKLSIRETIEKVQHNLPQLEAYRQQTIAAQQNISLAKNSLVPE